MGRISRPVVVDGDVARVILSGGLVALIDAADAPLVEAFTWSALVSKRTSYARRNEFKDGKQYTVLLHRVIAAAPPGLHVDHKNGDGLDCRRANLRLVTQQQNNLNVRGHRDSASGIKGVRKHPLCDKYQATISAAGARKHLGLFATAAEAHAAYCAASLAIHGEFGRAT